MSNYSKSTNFATKDNLTPGDPLKIVRGTEIDTEFNNIATAIATKTDNASAAIVGGTINDTTIGATTASTGAFTTLAASGNVTLSGGTANGVTYLNGSKVVTSGSALTFDGTGLGIGTGTIPAGRKLVIDSGNIRLSNDYQIEWGGSTVGLYGNGSTNSLSFFANTSEQMRLTSTGLGIGTSSPSYKLDVVGPVQSSAGYYINGNTGGGYVWVRDNYALRFGTNDTERLRISADGNLGLGVTPSAWSSATGLQVQNVAIEGRSSLPSYATLSANGYTQAGTWRYISSDFSSRYTQFQGQHLWFNAPSGTAGNAITFTQAATLTSSGDYLVGTTSSQGLLSNTTKIVGGNFITRQATTASLANTATEDITGLISGAAYTVVCRGDTNTTTFVIQSVYVNGAGGVTLGLISNGNGFVLTSPANNTLRVTGLVTTQTYTYSLTRIF